VARVKKLKNVKDGRIFFDEYPPDHAEQAFRDGYYIEALQTLHIWIEVKIQEWLLLSKHGNNKISQKLIWDVVLSIPLTHAAKALFVLGKMPKSTYDDVCKFNSMRNKIIHKLFIESYDGEMPSVKFEEYQKVFKKGIGLCEKLDWCLAKLATRGKVEHLNE
jgi:hypothetical protein